MRFLDVRINISNTRKRVSSDIQTLRSGLKKRGAAEFLNDFEVFGYLNLEKVHSSNFLNLQDQIPNAIANLKNDCSVLTH